MTDQLDKQQIQALLEERRGYEVRLGDAEGEAAEALKERVRAVNASLTKLGYKLTPKPVEKRPDPKVEKR